MTCLWQNVLRSKEYCVAGFWREKNAQHGNEVYWASHQRKVRNSNEQRKKTLLDAKAGSKQTQARVKKSMNNLNVNTNTNKTAILLPKYGNLLKVSFVGRFLQPVHILVFLLYPCIRRFRLISQESGWKTPPALPLRLPSWDVQVRVRLSPFLRLRWTCQHRLHWRLRLR